MEKIKLIVINEHTLGLVHPETPQSYEVLRSSVLKGAIFEVLPEPKTISSLDVIRLASEKDFDDFRVSFEGYQNRDEYEYETLNSMSGFILYIHDKKLPPLKYDYHYTVTHDGVVHTGFRTKRVLKIWLKHTGLKIGKRGWLKNSVLLTGNYIPMES